MSYLSIGDLAQALQQRQDNLRLRSDLARLSAELSTGRTADPTAAVSGDFGALGSIEASMARLSAYSLAGREAAMTAEGTQAALEVVQTNMTELAGPLLLTLGGEAPSLVDATAADARVRFSAVVAALNARVADRSLFAGAATDRLALADAEAMLDALMPAVAAETTAAGVEAVVRAWFDPGGDFDSAGYLGSAQPAAAVPLADGNAVDQPVTAADPVLRRTLAAFAMAAVLDRGALAGRPADRADLATRAGEALLNAETGLVELRARTGTREEQIDQAMARAQSGLAALELARTEMLAADPFETATRLKAAEAQLEALYTLTARLSRLSLTEYLR
ncbi:flagellin [Palleronia sp. KMU-117]|uniref:flagellin n=1 Tax=Palleronia sp. KMU-117 TaxID=3434108 RepID=UPI003D75ECA2